MFIMFKPVDNVLLHTKIKDWNWQAPYFNRVFTDVIKAQCFERGRRPDGIKNIHEFADLCIPLVALAAVVVRVLSFCMTIELS